MASQNYEGKTLALYHGDYEEWLETLRTEKSLYHRTFSDLRWNVLEWIPRDGIRSVLEIGSGLGEYTERLAVFAEELFVVEPNQKKSEFVRERCKDFENVTVWQTRPAEALEKIPERLSFLIVHETELFQSEEELSEFLSDIRKRWPECVAAVLCDNPEGLRYRSAGITPENLKTLHLRRKELLQVMEQAGYQDVKLYYPYPDSIYTLSLFSDNYLPQSGQIKKYSFVNLQDDFARDEDAEFEAAERAIREETFAEQSSSFLALTGIPVDWNLPWYMKYSNQRRNIYAIRTEIHADGTVRKCPLTPAGNLHIRNMYEYGERSRKQYEGTLFAVPEATVENHQFIYSYVEGGDLLGEMNRARKEGEEGFFILLAQWRDQILQAHSNSYFAPSPEFLAIFGDARVPASCRCGTVNNIDLVFDNIILTGDGKWTVLDNEWTFAFPIPDKYILFRGFFDYQHRGEMPSESFSQKGWKLLGIDQELYETFLRMEKNFQNYLKRNAPRIL